MANFAVVDGTNVINTIVADSKAIAEQITGYTCIQYTTESAETGGLYIDKTFVQKQPFPSWVLDNYVWKAPIEKPKDGKFYIWNEETVSWVAAN